MNAAINELKQEWSNHLLSNSLPSTVLEVNVLFLGPKGGPTEWLISKKIFFFVPLSLIIDREFILMIKDITLARSLSQLSMIKRQDRPNTCTCLSTLRA